MLESAPVGTPPRRNPDYATGCTRSCYDYQRYIVYVHTFARSSKLTGYTLHITFSARPRLKCNDNKLANIQTLTPSQERNIYTHKTPLCSQSQRNRHAAPRRRDHTNVWSVERICMA